MNIATESHHNLNKCGECALHNLPICLALPPAALEALDRISRTRTYSAGQTIVSEDDDAAIVGNVISGVLKMTKTLADGREQVVGLLFPSDFFGRAYAEHSSFSIEASSDVTLCVMDRHAFESVIERCRELEHSLLTSTLDELDATREWMVLLGCQNTREKVASFLLMLLRRFNNTGCRKILTPGTTVTIELPINRRDMAGYLGTTVETISRNIQALSKNGILKILDGRHFEIQDAARLAAVASHEEWLTEFQRV